MELLLLLFFFFFPFLNVPRDRRTRKDFLSGQNFFRRKYDSNVARFRIFLSIDFYRWIKNLSSLRVIIILKRMRIRGHPRIIIEIIIERIIIRIKSGTRLLHGLMGKPFCVKWCFVRRMHKYIGGDELYTLKRQV